MNDFKDKSFDVDAGIKVQDSHLKLWKCKLIPEAYADLVEFAKAKNHKAKDGYDITRGSDLDCFVWNWVPNK